MSGRTAAGAALAAVGVSLAGCGGAAVTTPGGGANVPAGGASATAVQVGRQANGLPLPTVEHTTKYGGLPSWLPSSAPPADQVVTASATHPARAALEGNTVDLEVDGASADATLVGPTVPTPVVTAVQMDRRNPELPVPASFSVAFVDRHGRFPLALRRFRILTEDGRVIAGTAQTARGAAAPSYLTPGAHVTLTVHANLPAGSGSVVWAPYGSQPFVAWEYVLEDD